jgi:8-oxo-dGTP pyrophosphatase MutT (NUDIX family)
MKREFSAGGVVVRRFQGRPFAAAVAPRRGVLALPKGHPDGDETMEQAATREVREETGLDGELVEKLDDVRYWYTRGGERVLKVVSFYLFRYRGGRIADHDDEIEHVEWVPLDELPERLSYTGEQSVARKALERCGR